MEIFHAKAASERGDRDCGRFWPSLRSRGWVGLFIGLFPTICLSQILPEPVFEFEKPSWGDSLGSVRKIFHGRGVREQNSEEQFGTSGGAMPSSLLMSYQDTLVNVPFRVVLWFSKAGEELNRIVVALIQPKPDEKREIPDADAIFTTAWEKLSGHYGSSFVEGGIPLLGKSRIWSFRGTDVLMMSVSGFGKKSFTITYSPNRKK